MLLCLTLLLDPGTSAFAADPTAPSAAAVDPLVRSIEARYAEVEVLRASFVQVARSPIYGEERQTGTLVLQRPNKMRWEFAEDGKRFVSDGTNLWMYTPADKQVLKLPAPTGEGGATDVLLHTLHHLSELFVVQIVASDPATGHVLSLVPTTPTQQAQFKKLELTLDPALVVRRVKVTDPSDTVTDLEFSGVELGAQIDDAQFRFEVPPGVQVIDAGS